MSIKYLALLHDTADWQAGRQAGRQQAGRPITSATVFASHTRAHHNMPCQNPIHLHRTVLSPRQGSVRL